MREANPTLTYVCGSKKGKTVSRCSGGSRCAENDMAEQLEANTDITGAKGWR